MDQFVERERLKALKIICLAYRPEYPLSSLFLGFPNLKETKKWLKSHKAHFVPGKEALDTKLCWGIFRQKWLDVSSKGVDIKGQIH
jgi:hypothetical protein